MYPTDRSRPAPARRCRDVYSTLHPSPVGDIQPHADAEGRLTGLYLRHDGTGTHDGPFDAAREQLDAYFAGELEAFDLPLAPHAVPAPRLGAAREDPVRRDDLLQGARAPAG